MPYGSKTVADLTKDLENASLTEFDVSNNASVRMRPTEFLQNISGPLKAHKGIKKVFLRDCELDDASMEILADILTENHVIEELDLQKNKINAAGAVVLADKGLAVNKGVKILNLNGQPHYYGGDTLDHFIFVYNTNVTLQKIICHMGDRKAWTLSKLMIRNTEIEKRQAAGKPITELLPTHLRESPPDLSMPAEERPRIAPPTRQPTVADMEEYACAIAKEVGVDSTLPTLIERSASSVGEALSDKKWDGDGVPLTESNCAEIGTAEDKAARKAAAAGEPAWEGVGQAPCLKVWRIEDFKVVAYPVEEYGSFYSGDSYIIVHGYMVEEKLCHTIFFWLGKDTTADEMGTAAYKTVELDDLLDGEPAQSREVQGHESDQFVSLFKNIRYLEGGVATGFNQVSEDTYAPRLCRCRKTKHGIRISQVTLSRESLNDGDSFILDAGTIIYVWDGAACAPAERLAANAAAEEIEGTRNGKAKATHDIDDAFWEKLGGQGDIASAESASDDIPEPTVGEGVLYLIEDGSGQLKTTEVGRGEVTSAMLDTSSVMMLDTESEIFLWVGSSASAGESRNAMRTAMNYLKINEKPAHTPIHVFKEGTAVTNPTWNKIFQ